MKENKHSSSGMDVLMLCIAEIALIVLRIFGAIRWSWWIVLAPIWVPVCIAVILVIAVLIWSGWRSRNGNIRK